MKKLFWILCAILFLFPALLSAGEEYIKGKVVKVEKAVSPESAEEGEIREVYPMRVLLLEGERKNEEVSIDFPVYRESAYNITVREGDSVVVFYDTEEEKESFYIVDVDKRGYLYVMGVIFILFALLFSRLKGIKGLFALILVIVVIYRFFIPWINRGGSPVGGAVVVATFASLVTIYLMTGFNSKGLVAIIGSVGGVVAAGSLSLLFVYLMRLTGYVTTETLNYAALLREVKLREVISAGVIVGSMGAVMDVGMSISSALNELREKKPDISGREMFSSGMNIGSDMIGTMINTLILAYVGSSLLTNILISLQKEQFPFIRILNFESIVVDVLRAMCGSIGILIAVPLTAWVASRMYCKR
ncbi:MAG: YibE/F family protein [Fusobacteriaceae bacterium]|nr:YibE/F family protein [Fusobacteriaceae bacterium]